MRCRTHPSDPGDGVCACCLRERLSALDVDPGEVDATPSSAAYDSCRSSQRSRTVKFSLPSPARSKQAPKKGEINDFVLKPTVSNSCLLAQIIRLGMKNKKKSPNISSVTEDACRGRSRRPHDPSVNRRGMSPASNNEMEVGGRGISTPSPTRKKVAATQPHNTQIRQGPRSLSTFTLCLNPMVRPSHGSVQAPLAGDIRRTFVRRGGAAAPDAFSGPGLNRSRKLADLGKQKQQVW